ncbi:HU family DNA-binding protein [Ekhidna sp.]|uniref:HU family DNA-binding protein n=1 Tax=Ekhidna sp. TaxID=2608089 RepID=UPI0035176316
MSVNYKLVERLNPRDLTQPKKYYASIINGDDITFEELAQLISRVSNLNYGSVVGTLATLVDVIELQLVHGRQVRLSDLGTLYLKLSSEGTENAEDFKSGNIRKASIRFRPGKRLKKVARNLKFEKVSNGREVEDVEGDIAA